MNLHTYTTHVYSKKEIHFQMGQKQIFNLPYLKASSLAWFIWNAEISISVAIHCYERLF